MGRWTQYDEDSYRLPDGMKRVGYDADTGKYYYRSRSGSLWEGAEGAQYGEMKKVSSAPIAIGDGTEDEEAEIGTAHARGDGYMPLAVDANGATIRGHGPGNNPYRILFPFFLIIAVVLLLVVRITHTTAGAAPPTAILCPGESRAYRIVAGDTCWDLSQARGCTLDDILNINPGLQCDSIKPGQEICLPQN